MAADVNFVKAKLQELSVTGGGSFVKRVVKSKINDSSKILFVGLGGLGCNSINEIKGVYQREYEQTNRVKFLAIDTDDDSLTKFNISNGGNLSADEAFQIYSEDAQQLLIHRPQVIKSWISEDVPSEKIGRDGAKARRAVGRVMLCGTGKYLALESRINSIINDLKDTGEGTVNVVLVAGISGGTGSGTFIDIGYMIRILLDEKFKNENLLSDYFGIFYTPDVQKSIPEVGGDPSTWANVRRNGYAALKELDYFMNVGKEGQSQAVYSVTLPGNVVRSSGNSIFEKNKVFIITTTPQNNQCQNIVQSTAASIMNMFRPGVAEVNKLGVTVTQSVLSNLCNLNSQISTWLTNNVGEPSGAGDDVKKDICGIKHTTFPAFMNYNYSSFGFREIYFPRNEMVAYCANEAFSKVYDIWKRAFMFNDNMILNIAQKCHLESLDRIFNVMSTKLGIDDSKFLISATEDSYPIRQGFDWAGRVINTSSTVEAAKSKVDTALKAIQISDSKIQSFVDTLRAQTLENKEFIVNFGPFGGIVVLKGNQNAKGIISRLQEFRDKLPQIINDKAVACKNAQNNMMKAKDIMERDRTPHDDEMQTFVNHCNNYSNAYFEYCFFNNFMKGLLDRLISKLIDFNNETFDIYVPIIDTVKDILNTDATAFAESTFEHKGNTSVYSLNAFDLESALSKNNLFKDMFDGYIDQQKVEQVAYSFAGSLFNHESREKWKNYIDAPVALADELRRLFSVVINPLVNSMLEKFMVIVYGDKHSILSGVNKTDKITIDDVNRIWEHDNLRNNALRTAARNMVEALSGADMVKLDILPTDLANLSDHVSVILLAETPNLNEYIKQELMAKYDTRYSYSVVGGEVCDRKTSITLTSRIAPIALPLVRDMQDFATEYFKSAKGVSCAGRHLDEVTERWQDNLPEIFGVDAEEYFVEELGNTDMVIQDSDRAIDNEGKVKNEDRTKYEQIRQDVDYGIENGYIYLNKDNKYVMVVLTDTSEAFLEKLKTKLIDMRKYTDGAPVTWIDALKALEAETHHADYKIVELSKNLKNDPLIARQGVSPLDDYSIKNVYRIVRYDIKTAKLVAKNKSFFEESNFFHDIENLTELQYTLKMFLMAYRCGLISYDEYKGYSIKYSSNEFNKPILFFDDSDRKNPSFDEPLKWHCVISAFAKVLKDERVTKGIEDAYFPYTRNVLAPDLVVVPTAHICEELKAVANLPLFANDDKKVRDMMIENCLRESLYKDYYSYPLRIKNANTLFENLDLLFGAFDYFKMYRPDLLQ